MHFDLLCRLVPTLLEYSPRPTSLTSSSETCGPTELMGSTVGRYSSRPLIAIMKKEHARQGVRTISFEMKRNADTEFSSSFTF